MTPPGPFRGPEQIAEQRALELRAEVASLEVELASVRATRVALEHRLQSQLSIHRWPAGSMGFVAGLMFGMVGWALLLHFGL